jgi:adenine-specific DNA-methyltransferase
LDSTTLHQGDCLEYLQSMESNSVDAVMTDPPYGKGYHDGGPPNVAGTKWRGVAIAGDKRADTRFVEEVSRVLKVGGAFYMFSQWMVESVWIDAIREAGMNVRNRIIWAKPHWGMGDPRTTYGPQHETILFASKGRHELKGKRCGDVWVDNSTSAFRRGRVHPNQKPVELMVKAIERSTSPGDTVLDPFMGSGTTGVACARTGRNFIGVEIEESYFEIARRRMELSEVPHG